MSGAEKYPGDIRHFLFHLKPEKDGFKYVKVSEIKVFSCSLEKFRKIALQMGYFCKTQGSFLILSKVRFSMLLYEKQHAGSKYVKGRPG